MKLKELLKEIEELVSSGKVGPDTEISVVINEEDWDGRHVREFNRDLWLVRLNDQGEIELEG